MTVLDQHQRDQMHREGYLVIRDAVPRDLVDAALTAINHRLEQGFVVERLSLLRDRTWCPELCTRPVITDLITRSGAIAAVRALIGEPRPVDFGQIPLRFPAPGDQPPVVSGAHIDGYAAADNGIDPSVITSFTMLAVVLLSDVPEPWMGNFTLWPGSHLQFERHFREHGPEVLMQGMPALELGQPLQITGRAGDLVLAHYLTAHTGAPNRSPHIRYATIYRLFHHDHVHRQPTGPLRREALMDAWLEWPGIRGAAVG